MLSQEQAAFLINMGLVTLVSAGTAQVHEMSEEEFKEEVQKTAGAAEGDGTTVPDPATDEAQRNYLEFVDKDTLPKA